MTSEHGTNNEKNRTRENAIQLFSAADSLMGDRDAQYADDGFIRKLELTVQDILKVGRVLVKHNLEVADSASVSFIREESGASLEHLLISLRRDGIDTDYWVVVKDDDPEAIEFEKEVTSVNQPLIRTDQSGNEISDAAFLANVMMIMDDAQISEDLGLNIVEPNEQKALIEIIDALRTLS
jgi:hypothetical protein